MFGFANILIMDIPENRIAAILSEMAALADSLKERIGELEKAYAEEVEAYNAAMEALDCGVKCSPEVYAELETHLAEVPAGAVEHVAEPAESGHENVATEASEDVEPVEEVVSEQEEKPAQKKAVNDVMSSSEAWRHDKPGAPVEDIRSAITLNDRLLFINSLFGGDADKFRETVMTLNSMSGTDEAAAYLKENNPDWDFGSETVYRFMMAARRKLG